MSQLKPIIIVMLMLTSALAGCTGTDTTDLEQQIADLQQSNDEMNETMNQQNQANTELQTQLDERNTEIATLNTNVAMLQSSIIDAETYRDSLLVLLEDSNNTILTLQSDIVVQQNLVAEWILRAVQYDFSNADLSNADLSGVTWYYTICPDFTTSGTHDGNTCVNNL